MSTAIDRFDEGARARFAARGRTIVRDDLPWGLLLAPSITIVCSIVMPRVAARLGGRSGIVFWSVLLPTMVLCAGDRCVSGGIGRMQWSALRIGLR